MPNGVFEGLLGEEKMIAVEQGVKACVKKRADFNNCTDHESPPVFGTASAVRLDVPTIHLYIVYYKKSPNGVFF